MADPVQDFVLNTLDSLKSEGQFFAGKTQEQITEALRLAGRFVDENIAELFQLIAAPGYIDANLVQPHAQVQLAATEIFNRAQSSAAEFDSLDFDAKLTARIDELVAAIPDENLTDEEVRTVQTFIQTQQATLGALADGFQSYLNDIKTPATFDQSVLSNEINRRRELIWAKAKDRLLAALTDQHALLVDQFAGRGFAMPQGALLGLVERSLRAVQDQMGQLARDQSIEEIEAQRRNLEFVTNTYLRSVEVMLALRGALSQLVIDGNFKLAELKVTLARAVLDFKKVAVDALALHITQKARIVEVTLGALKTGIDAREGALRTLGEFYKIAIGLAGYRDEQIKLRIDVFLKSAGYYSDLAAAGFNSLSGIANVTSESTATATA